LVARRRARRRSLCAYQAAVSTAAQLCPRHSCERRTANVGSSLPRQARFGQRRASRSPTTATRRTWCARRGLPRRTDVFRIQRGADSLDAEAADTGRLSVRTPGSHQSRGHRTPGHRTSARPVGWTDVRTTDRERGQGDDRHGRRPDTLDGHGDRDHPLGFQISLGLQRLRRSATHGGDTVMTPTSAALIAAPTGQLRNTARHEVAPRRTALLG
jgi:hypothetical protein